MGALRKEDTVVVEPRFPARPREKVDLAAIREKLNQRFSKTFEYLAR